MTDCAPRFASPRTARKTSGAAVAATARQLGLDLLPWQRQVVDTALERAGGRPAYRDVLVSVPRQSGKSSLALALIVWKMLQAPLNRTLYAAQTRAAAREKLLLGWWPLLASSPLADRFTLYRGFGAEMVTADNGSTLQLLSATETSGHGGTTDLCVIDEAWVHQDARVEQSVRPTMSTRKEAQLWIVSTAGTWTRSTWWRKKLEAGRAAAEMGVDTGICLLDWSASPGANEADEATWWQCMPGLGRLTDVETVRADLAGMGVEEFRRAYLNLWTDTTDQDDWSVFNQEIWEAARDD